MKYAFVLYIRWDEKENVFYDTCGFMIGNIFEMITPNDVYLFRQDHGNCSFPHREDRNVLCEIIIED